MKTAVAREICSGMCDQERPFMDSSGKPLPTMQHCKSGVLHCRDSDARLCCGRLVTRCFSTVDSLKCKWPVCAQCRAKCPLSVPPKPKASSVAKHFSEMLQTRCASNED